MALKVYRLDQSMEWDNIVHSFNDYDVYWLSGYVKAFRIHGDGEPMLLYFISGDTKGINVVFKRDISKDKKFIEQLEKDKYFDLSTPYGYGGWLIEGEDTKQLFKEYESWCIDNGIISEFVRFHPLIKNQGRVDDFYNVVPLGETITLDLSSPEVIWNNLTSKNRNMIRKAKKNGIKIYRGQYPEIYEKFREIYNETMEKDNASEYYYFDECFYESILNDLSSNAEVFYAVLENQVIAASIMLMSNGMMNYHLSGSKREYQNLAPSNLLLYEAALWGNKNGYKTLYMGGGIGSGEDSLFKFKRSFYRGDDLNRFHIGKKIFVKDVYDELVSKRCSIDNMKFFPLYRG